MHHLRNTRSPLGRSSAGGSPFDLQARQHQADIERLLAFSNTPQVSIHFEILDEQPQRATIYRPSIEVLPATSNASVTPCPSTMPDPSTTADPSTTSSIPFLLEPQGVSTSPIPPEIALDHRGLGNDTIYAIASYTKILINVAYARLMMDGRYKDLGLSWESSACDIFNHAREQNGKTLMLRTWGNPTIRQLLLHENGLAEMNRYLFAPDGAFIMNEEEFILVAPLITEDCYKEKYPDRGWFQYSNANHILAGMILEELTGRSLQDLMRELVFDWLDMTHTFLDERSLTSTVEGTTVATGFRVSASRNKLNSVPCRYMSDVVEAASLGARSTTGDLAKLNRAFLNGTEGRWPGTLGHRGTADFFRLEVSLNKGEAMSLGGRYGPLDSSIPGTESLSRAVSPPDGFSSYTLGRRQDGSQCNVYYKGGCIDGFNGTIYLSLKDRAFVIVLGNSSGPVDISDHIARYILQEAFQLRPRTDVIGSAMKEGHRCSNYLGRYDIEDSTVPMSRASLEDLAGTYKHVRYLQNITVTHDGAVTVHGSVKSSAPMKLSRISSSMIKILPGADGFGVERWSVWKNLEFAVEVNSDGLLSLRGNDSLDSYVKIS
jgi:CubicO group peptidase (beta-lactamase class C family)